MIIVAGYLLVGSLFALTTPAWQNPDEPAHYNNIAEIATGGGLPVLRHGDYDEAYMNELKALRFPPSHSIDAIRYEAYQPPLYYVAAAPVYLLGEGSLLTLRLLSVGLGAFVIILLYLCVELIFPTKPLLPVGAAAFAAFLPMQVAMSAAVNNDGLAQLLLLAAMLSLLRWMRQRFYRRVLPSLGWPMLLVLGLLLGLGMLTKIYAYLVLALCAGLVGLTVWLHTDERFWARADRPSGRTTGRTHAEGALVSMLRPHERNLSAWLAVARRTGKLRVLGSTTLESAFVAAGALDAFIDPGSDTHRLVDLAAAVVLLEAAGGAVVDALGRPIEFDIDLTRRWSGIAAATPALAAELADLVAETLEPVAG